MAQIYSCMKQRV